MDSKHTPRPWCANAKHSGPSVWRVEVESAAWFNDGYIIADLWGPDAEANAHLIAAAPDLLDALISTRDSLQAMADEGIVAQDSWPTLDAAIAKATGQ